MSTRRPEIIVFAGPNGSGKSTVTANARIIEPYINADDIKCIRNCSELEAAQEADNLRLQAINQNISFTFETVLSTPSKIKLLQYAKTKGYFIRCIYVLTTDVNINVMRTMSRLRNGGHGVPPEKVISRYYKCFEQLAEVYRLSDVFYLYDNTIYPTRIAVKKKDVLMIYENEYWNEKRIYEILENK